ncbi:hypothetical protein [Actinoplanes sp. ATCC 53533]|uniref:hypothetical protein n=1 Tax=Actinoplanes sp. ATCC 53533 TaxID=1288362 RepID=UPI0018F6E2ED|nr:hypothetical protein [Actinoplanes sp. ATCC 53533]
MRKRALAAALAAVTLAGAFGTAGPASAYPSVVVAVAPVVVDDAAEREFLLWLAQSDERAMVRSTAWSALLSDEGYPAIQRFFDSEYDYAEQLSASSRTRNKDFVAYVLATCVPTYAREVCVAAQRASRGTDADREAFVRTGYAGAKERDRRVREAAGKEAAALVEADRAVVAVLRDSDPGAQVRAAAAWALRPGSVDGDVVEFFAYGWAHAAGLDVRAYRTQLAADEVAWRRTVNRLIAEAQAAELAARAAAGEAAAQARRAAAQAWATVADNTGPARVAWQRAEQVALAQAETWRQVAAAAAANQSPNWTPVLGTADTMGRQWTVERDQVSVQSAYWTGLYQRALAAEHAWTAAPAA